MSSSTRQKSLGFARACLAFALALFMMVTFAAPSAWAIDSLQQTTNNDAADRQTPADAPNDTSADVVDVKFFIALCPDAEEYPASLTELENMIRNNYTGAMNIEDALNIADLPETSSDVKIDSVADKGASIKARLVCEPSEAAITQACAEKGLDYSSEKYAIVWYVAKDKTDGWHIDGLLIPRDIIDPKPAPDPGPTPNPEPEPGPDPQPSPEPAKPTLDSTLTSIPSAPAISTNSTAEAEQVARVAEPASDATSLVVSPTTSQSLADDNNALSTVEEAFGLSDSAAAGIRAAGFAGAVIALVGLGLTGAGATGAISGLSSMDSSLRKTGRKF